MSVVEGVAAGRQEQSAALDDSRVPRRERVRLAFLDGIRGLAALYVVLYHSYVRIVHTSDGSRLPPWLAHATNWMGYGHHAVSVFIVLSGFCLMLPVVASESGQLSGGVRGFITRRVRRIFPPYYFALLFSVLMIVAGRKLHVTSAVNSAKLGAQLSKGSLISHLFLVHNINFNWAKAIDPPMWSVATEWDIYLVFALLLLPLWRRLGIAFAIGAAFALSLALHYLVSHQYNGDWAGPWYLGLFALGMAGAALTFSRDDRLRVWSHRLPWGAIALAFSLLMIMVACLLPRQLYSGVIGYPQRWLIDLIPGIATTALIISCVNRLRRDQGDAGWLLGLLESRWVVWLGTFSYSLYLIHQPLVEALYQVIHHFHPLSALSLFVLYAVAIIPAIMAISYGFHLLFERPFMSSFAKDRIAKETGGRS